MFGWGLLGDYSWFGKYFPHLHKTVTLKPYCARMNLIDPEQLEGYILDACDMKRIKDERTRTYVVTALTKALTNDPRFTTEVYDLPETAPEWLKKKWPDGGPYHQVFLPALWHDTDLHAQIKHIIDWIAAAVNENDPWLTNHTDSKGRPYRLLQIKTLSDATRMADEDMRIKSERLANQMKNYVGDEETVAKFDADGRLYKPGDDGYDALIAPPYRIARLSTPTELDYESAKLRHCIGNGAYDKHLKTGEREYFSLRDVHNIAHATLEIDRASNRLLQCKGAQNLPPVSKYMPMVQAFIKDRHFELKEGISHTGLIEQDGEYYDVLNLPPGLNYKGSLKYNWIGAGGIWKALPLTTLPEHLSISGNLDLRQVRIATLPEHLTVGGDLILGDSRITTLPEHLTVGGDLYLTYTRIREIPASATIKGTIHGLAPAKSNSISDIITEGPQRRGRELGA